MCSQCENGSRSIQVYKRCWVFWFTVKCLCSQCASGSQGESHVHSIQEMLNIWNYCKVFVFAVCRWVTGSVSRAQYATVSEYYEFFPLVCLMSNYEADEELSKTCVTVLAMMGQAMALPQHVPVVLNSASKVSDSRPICWHAIIMWAMMCQDLSLLLHMSIGGLWQ